jgi:hypothetical protein
MKTDGDEGTAYLLQQFWVIRIISPYLPMAGAQRSGEICGSFGTHAMQPGHAKGAPGLAFETWDPPSKGQSRPTLHRTIKAPNP